MSIKMIYKDYCKYRCRMIKRNYDYLPFVWYVRISNTRAFKKNKWLRWVL